MKKISETTVSITPKGIIFQALGGYQNKQAKELAESIEQKLLEFMSKNNLDIVIWNNDEQKSIKFYEKNE